MSADDTLTLSATDRTRLRRHAERGRTDRADLYAVLDAGLICHLGVVMDGLPVVLPTAYGRVGDTLYLHGSSANRSILAADGQEVCVTVTHLDGSGLRPRGLQPLRELPQRGGVRPRPLVTDDEERLAALRAVTEQLIPGRWAAAQATVAQGARRHRGARRAARRRPRSRSAPGRPPTSRPTCPGRVGRSGARRADLRRAGAGPGPAPGHRRCRTTSRGWPPEPRPAPRLHQRGLQRGWRYLGQSPRPRL